MSSFGFFSNGDCAQNPDLCNWNHVHVPYCSQDLHGGQRTEPSQDSWGLYFAGRYIFDAIVDDLVAKHGLGDATEIILSGDSAGGIGTWYHLDRLAQRFPKARVVGAPVAGFYFYVRGRRGAARRERGVNRRPVQRIASSPCPQNT